MAGAPFARGCLMASTTWHSAPSGFARNGPSPTPKARLVGAATRDYAWLVRVPSQLRRVWNWKRSSMARSNVKSVLFLGPSDITDIMAMGTAIDLVEESYA